MRNDKGQFVKGMTPHNKKEDVDHGDWLMYNRGCHCDLCKRAATFYYAELNGRVPLEIQKTLPCKDCGLNPRRKGSRRCKDCLNEISRVAMNKKSRPDNYDELSQLQQGLCAICGDPETALRKSGKIKELAADHNHETSEWRGLLCARCNTALGLFGDDPEILEAAINYLRLWGV